MLCDDGRRAALGALHFPSTEVLNLSVFFHVFFATRILLHPLSSACRLMLSDAQNETGVPLRVDHLENKVAAYRFCGKRVSLQRNENSLHRATLESFYKLLGRKNATPEVHVQLVSMLSTIFYLLPCKSLSLSLLLLQSTKRSAFSLRFHEHMMTILSMKSKMSKIR